jgi:hypothetical protein
MLEFIAYEPTWGMVMGTLVGGYLLGRFFRFTL